VVGRRSRAVGLTKGDDTIKKPATITNSEANAINVHLDLQDSLIFRLCIETGARISDILKLTASELRVNPINIHESKSKRPRSVYVSEELHGSLLRWFTRDSDKIAFRSPIDVLKPYNRMTYHRHLKRAASYRKINVSAHSARKLYARNVFQRTGDIFAVQKALHHKYITTTATYLDIDLEQLIKNAVTLQN
jgi:integrase